MLFKKEEKKTELKKVVHDAKVFTQGALMSTGLVVGFTLGVLVKKK